MKFFAIVLTLVTSLSVFASAKTEAKKQEMEAHAKETYHDAGRGIKSGTRKVEDETCDMVHGKMECAGKKAKHSLQNAADKAEDKMD